MQKSVPAMQDFRWIRRSCRSFSPPLPHQHAGFLPCL